MTPEERANRICQELLQSGPSPEARIEAEIREAEEAARREEREACALQVRHDCSACNGTGHADAETECEYCGRPMHAIRARGKHGETS